MDYKTYNTIYMIKNKETGKKYIGRTINIVSRWADHLSTLRRGAGFKKMQPDFDKYGESSFELEVLEKLPLEKCNPPEREDYYILKYNTIEEGYNTRLNIVISPPKSIATLINQEIHIKVSELAKENNISVSQWLKNLIEKEIEKGGE